MNLNSDFIKRVLLSINYDTKMTLDENKNTILKEEEDSSQCRDDWYWYAEMGTDERYEKGIKCWDGKDPLSCKLRKYLGKQLNAGIGFCSNLRGVIPCSESLSYRNACAIGKISNSVINPYFGNKSWSRIESYVVDPIGPNNSNLSIQVFIERKELISILDATLGKENRKLAGERGYILGMSYAWYGSQDGCWEWRVENVSDDVVINTLNMIKNQTSIPFGDAEEGETNVQYVEDGKGKATQTISSKIINTTDPKTGKKYNFKEVQAAFGVKPYNKKEPKDSTNNKENFNDNIKLNKAWESGWRPNNGMEVPDNLQTSTYKENKNKINSDIVTSGDSEAGLNLSGNSNNATGESSVEGTGFSQGGLNVHGYGNEDFVASDQEVPGLENAKFNGNFYTWFNENFNYPEEAIKNNIQGTVNLTFTIDVDGKISNITTESDDLVNKLLIDSAISLIKKMPDWIPAKKDGKNIISKITIPIEYTLFDYYVN